MENLSFINNQKNSRNEFIKKFDQEYDPKYRPEFYPAMNFRNIWYNACNAFISSKQARDLVKADYRKSAESTYKELIAGNFDSMVMFDFTFYCQK